MNPWHFLRLFFANWTCTFRCVSNQCLGCWRGKVGSFTNVFWRSPSDTGRGNQRNQRKALHWKLEFSSYESLDLFVPCAGPQGRSIPGILWDVFQAINHMVSYNMNWELQEERGRKCGTRYPSNSICSFFFWTYLLMDIVPINKYPSTNIHQEIKAIAERQWFFFRCLFPWG